MFKIRVRGRYACFTRPEFKAERVSYDVMTPSAARGVVETILWKPAIRWHIHQIDVLAPIRWESIRRNEVQSKASSRVPYIVADATTERAQRNALLLRDVDYVLTLSFTMTRRAGPADNPVKFTEMFARRLEHGQHVQQPYLGCREFSASVEPAPATYETISDTRPLGLMVYDFEPVDEGAGRPLYFDARLVQGSVTVPHIGDVVRAARLSPRRP